MAFIIFLLLSFIFLSFDNSFVLSLFYVVYFLYIFFFFNFVVLLFFSFFIAFIIFYIISTLFFFGIFNIFLFFFLIILTFLIFLVCHFFVYSSEFGDFIFMHISSSIISYQSFFPISFIFFPALPSLSPFLFSLFFTLTHQFGRFFLSLVLSLNFADICAISFVSTDLSFQTGAFHELCTLSPHIPPLVLFHLLINVDRTAFSDVLVVVASSFFYFLTLDSYQLPLLLNMFFFSWFFSSFSFRININKYITMILIMTTARKIKYG